MRIRTRRLGDNVRIKWSRDSFRRAFLPSSTIRVEEAAGSFYINIVHANIIRMHARASFNHNDSRAHHITHGGLFRSRARARVTALPQNTRRGPRRNARVFRADRFGRRIRSGSPFPGSFRLFFGVKSSRERMQLN